MRAKATSLLEKHPQWPVSHSRTFVHQELPIFFSTFYFIFYHNAVIISGQQGRNSTTHMHVSILPQTPLPSRLPCNIEQGSLCCTVGPCWLCNLNIARRSLFLTKFETVARLACSSASQENCLLQQCEDSIDLGLAETADVWERPPCQYTRQQTSSRLSTQPGWMFRMLQPGGVNTRSADTHPK